MMQLTRYAFALTTVVLLLGATSAHATGPTTTNQQGDSQVILLNQQTLQDTMQLQPYLFMTRIPPPGANQYDGYVFDLTFQRDPADPEKVGCEAYFISALPDSPAWNNRTAKRFNVTVPPDHLNAPIICSALSKAMTYRLLLRTYLTNLESGEGMGDLVALKVYANSYNEWTYGNLPDLEPEFISYSDSQVMSLTIDHRIPGCVARVQIGSEDAKRVNVCAADQNSNETVLCSLLATALANPQYLSLNLNKNRNCDSIGPGFLPVSIAKYAAVANQALYNTPPPSAELGNIAGYIVHMGASRTPQQTCSFLMSSKRASDPEFSNGVFHRGTIEGPNGPALCSLVELAIETQLPSRLSFGEIKTIVDRDYGDVHHLSVDNQLDWQRYDALPVSATNNEGYVCAVEAGKVGTLCHGRFSNLLNIHAPEAKAYKGCNVASTAGSALTCTAIGSAMQSNDSLGTFGGSLCNNETGSVLFDELLMSANVAEPINFNTAFQPAF